jgi:hypothetical protein
LSGSRGKEAFILLFEVVRKYPLLVVGLLFSITAEAQAPVYLCASGRPDTSACAKAVASTLKVKKNRLCYKNAPINRLCSLEGSFVMLFGSDGRHDRTGFHLDCEEMRPFRPFNNRLNGFKHGLWFELTLLGRVKRAVQYDSGHATTVLTFWPNGLPRHYERYKRSGQLILGSSQSYPQH